MLTIVTVVLIFLAIALFAFAPWKVTVGGAIGGIIGGIAGSSAGLASGGDATNAWKFVGLVGFVVGGGFTYIGLLHRRLREAQAGIRRSDDEDFSAGALLIGMVILSWQAIFGGSSTQETDESDNEAASTQQSKPAIKTTVAQEYESREPSTAAPLLGWIVIIAVATAWYQGWIGQWLGFNENDSSSSVVEEREQHERLTQRNYDRLVKELGYTVPAIDPSSDHYDAAWVERIRERRETYVEQGYDEWEAFVTAVEDFVIPPERAEQTERSEEATSQADSRSETPTNKDDQIPSSTDSTSADRDRTEGDTKCVLKNVMSDADYRACGIDPP